IKFPQLAERALHEAALHQHVEVLDIVRWTLSADRLPKQNLEATFGNPPLTLYTCGGFYIQALFWLDGTTSIHDHAFSGAFTVLAGSSIHSRFEFERTMRV